MRAAELWQRHWPALAVATLLLAALLPFAAAPRAAPVPRHVEWPQVWEGKPLRPLATTAVEQRFAARFPGAIARFSDGQRVLVLRRVTEPTRMLHPAADCFRGLGYRIERTQLEHDTRARLWRCFEAEGRDGERLRVCERIAPIDETSGAEASGGEAFVDASSWFWAAALGRSRGPWQAVTVVEAM
ncbi:hypothetical protein [Piscinibacter sp.]|uniref:hypothetical protein n=1 Tax=Piscinibacter sp. TaxID=1903157 RepID=UPI0035B3F5FC